MQGDFQGKEGTVQKVSCKYGLVWVDTVTVS